MAVKFLCREGFWGPGGQQIIHEPLMHPRVKKSQEHPGCIRKSAASRLMEIPSAQPC